MSETPSSSGDEEIEAITSEILAALQTKDFFGRLEAKLWPHGPDEVSVCCHNLSYSRELLSEHFPEDDQDDIFAVFRSRGGYCDCEVIYNVLEESLPKEIYWKKRAEELRQKKA